MKRGYKALLDEANAAIRAVSPQEAATLSARDDTVLVDIRDVRELQREGKVPGLVHFEGRQCRPTGGTDPSHRSG